MKDQTKILIGLTCAVPCLVVAAYVGLLPVVLLSMAGMVACDFFGVLLGVGEARGQDDVAGIGDVGSDFFGKYVLASWSGAALTHSGHGPLGWLCIVPVLVTGFFMTKYTTRWARRIKQHPQTSR